MDGIHLIDALARVIAKHSGRTPERVIAALTRDVDDPALWRSHRGSSLESDDSATRRLGWQRVQTRKSRLVVRLCEELVATSTDTLRTDPVLGMSLSYFQQLSSAIILHQYGHVHEGAELARRALLRASAADDSSYALLAGDVVVAMQVHSDNVRSRNRFDAERRRWREIDHARRTVEEFLVRCLEYRRHLTDRSKFNEIADAHTCLPACSGASIDPVVGVFASALEVHEHLMNRSNAEALALLDSVTANVHVLPPSAKWVGQWLLVARAKALLALGDYKSALHWAESLPSETFHRVYLKCDVARVRSIALMRLGEWKRAHQSIIAGMKVASGQDDSLDQQRQMVIIAYFNLGAALGYHSQPLSIGTKRVASLMNSIDLVLQDRMGLAPIMLIYEVAAYLLEGKYELAERKMSNLQVFSTRNLRFHGASALRAFISLLRMLVVHKAAFSSNDRRVRVYMSKITDEHESATEQMICPLPLRNLAQSLIDHCNGCPRYTSV